jgi:hypothetical protein
MPMDWGLARDYAARDAHTEETLVTEAEWLAATDPQPMLELLYRKGNITERKLRLFAAACCRHARPADHDADRLRLLEAIESFADEIVSGAELFAAFSFVNSRPRKRGDRLRVSTRAALAAASSDARDAANTVALVLGRPGNTPGRGCAVRVAEQASLMRDIMGYPWKPPSCVDTGVLSRNGTPIGSMAQTIYDQRTFDRLPLLADALEDAGCSDGELLGHLRGPGPHVRGCWAVDLLLAKT